MVSHIDLGKPLALDFAIEFLPDDFAEVRGVFGKTRAYAIVVADSTPIMWTDQRS
jgi:hypothetical protein